MEHPTRSPWTTDVVTAAGTGVITALFPSHRWSRGAQWRLHGGMGVLAAAVTAVGVWTHEPDDGEDRPSPATVVALGTGIGLLSVAGSRGGQAVDAWVERSLAARGVRRPRLWIGIAAAGLALGASAVERRRDHASGDPDA